MERLGCLSINEIIKALLINITDNITVTFKKKSMEKEKLDWLLKHFIAYNKESYLKKMLNMDSLECNFFEVLLKKSTEFKNIVAEKELDKIRNDYFFIEDKFETEKLYYKGLADTRDECRRRFDDMTIMERFFGNI